MAQQKRFGSLKMLAGYLRYYFFSKTKHDIHSPFLFNFITDVLEDEREFYAFSQIEKIRRKLLTNSTIISADDLGTGSNSSGKLREIVRQSAIKPKFGRLLFNLVNYFECTHILELGTSAGISTLYLASSKHSANVITLEGNKGLAAVARKNFEDAGVENIRLMEGNFDQTLKEALHSLPSLDLVFFDGNHRLEPTLNYFNLCLEKAHANTVFIFDDIHWSEEMEEAWRRIKTHTRVTVSVDLYFMGMVFFREGLQKQEEVIRF